MTINVFGFILNMSNYIIYEVLSMATIRKSNKKKIIIPICIVLILAIAGGSVFAVRAKNKTPVVSLASIGTDNIVETVNATGTITSSTKREYSPSTIANCKDVYVKVGDTVKKGDKLATFNTEELDAQVKSLQASYNDASRSEIRRSRPTKCSHPWSADITREIPRR